MIKKGGQNKIKYRDNKIAYLMLMPAVLLLMLFNIIPLFMSGVRSFQDYATHEWVGFEHYDYVLKTPAFRKSLGNVVIFTCIIVVLMLILTFLFAHVLKGMRGKFAGAVKVIIYIPCILSGLVVSILFAFITNFGGGLITSILISMGERPIAFEIQGNWPYLMIIIPTLWLGFGYNTLVMYAGLLNVPQQYYEAAKIDGAGWMRRTIYITIPCMRNYILLMLVNLITSNLQMLDIPLFLTQGGPLNRTITPALYLYNLRNDAVVSQNVTIAGALILMLIILCVNTFTLRLIKSVKSGDV